MSTLHIKIVYNSKYIGSLFMIDIHYDLLSIAYIAYLEEIAKYFNDKNVIGVIANLYFMSPEEMSDELHPNYYRESVSVLEMFKIAKKVQIILKILIS